MERLVSDKKISSVKSYDSILLSKHPLGGQSAKIMLNWGQVVLCFF